MRRFAVGAGLAGVVVAGMAWVGPVSGAGAGPTAQDVRVVNATSLLYRTPSGAQAVPAPTRNIDVRSYEQVRVAAANRCGSPGSIRVILTHGEGSESVVRLDEVVLAPCASFSRSYDVPGTGMFLMAHPVTAGQTGNFYDAVVYGHN